MKLNKWLYGAAALAMLAACSERDIAPGGGENGGGNKFTEGVNYLAITLELPSELETRAKDDGDQGNDNFDDGTSNEYNVDNAALLLFKGLKTPTDGSDPEATAKFVGAYVINAAEAFDQPNKDNITVSFQKAIKVLSPPDIDETEQLWGLAIVNYKAYKNESDPGHFKIDAGENLSTYGDLTIRTVVSTPVKNDKDEITSYTYTETPVTPVRLKNEKPADGIVAATFADIRKYISDCNFLKGTDADGKPTSIFMTNAPLSSSQGISSKPSGTIQTLAKLNNNFKETETEAIQNPAGCIFVERAVAKVTCSEFPKYAILSHTIVENASTGAAGYIEQKVKLPIKSVQWIIDNEEKTSYIVRNSQKTDTWWTYQRNNYKNSPRYRFVGNSGMNDYEYDSDPVHNSEGAISTWYRTYWCQDPTYGITKDFNDQASATGAKFRDLITSPSNNNLYASKVPLYPHENTFDVKHQTYENTTRVVFKVTYDTKGKIVTIDADGKETEGAEISCNLYAVRGELKTFYLEQDAENLFNKSVLGSPSLHKLIKEILAKPGNNAVEYDATDVKVNTISASADDSDKEIVKGDLIVGSISFTDKFWERSDIQYNSLTEAMADPTRKTEIEDLLNKIVEDANSDYHIVPFTDNTCYYAVYIQHFGDTYCGLPEGWKGTTTTAVYTDSENDYLGRYGMVRNNWYDLAIGKIGNLGRALVPNGKVDISDDNNVEEWFLSARIHVLSWAKRTQKHDF